MVKRIKGRTFHAVFILFVLSFCMFFPAALGAQPNVTDITPADVTTRSFSVVWLSDLPSTADVKVFTDIGGSSEITSGLTVEPHPLMCGNAGIRTAAENAGVMKVTVSSGATSLEAGAVYYVQTLTTDKATSAVTASPGPGALVAVTLADESVRTIQVGGDLRPLTNDLLAIPGHACDGTSPAQGAAVLLEVDGADHPVSSFAPVAP